MHPADFPIVLPDPPRRAAVEPAEPILQFFAYDDLPPLLTQVARPFSDLAQAIARGDRAPGGMPASFGDAFPLPRNAERTVALRKLLEARDAALRAVAFMPERV